MLFCVCVCFLPLDFLQKQQELAAGDKQARVRVGLAKTKKTLKRKVADGGGERTHATSLRSLTDCNMIICKHTQQQQQREEEKKRTFLSLSFFLLLSQVSALLLSCQSASHSDSSKLLLPFDRWRNSTKQWTRASQQQQQQPKEEKSLFFSFFFSVFLCLFFLFFLCRQLAGWLFSRLQKQFNCLTRTSNRQLLSAPA